MRGGTVQINWHDVQPVLTLDFHAPTGLLATGGNDHEIKLWVITPGESPKKLPTATYQNSLCYHGAAVNVLRFSPSGEYIASGADGGELVIWKLHIADDSRSWKVLKTLLFHRKDVLDLQWSADGLYLISGSVDNSCIIWDINKGSVQQILDAHQHYVQGVAWDPLGHHVASLSSDRTCRVYVNKPQAKHKGHDKINFVCQHVLTKLEPQKLADSKPPLTKTHLFHDETLPSFFRRPQWSPDGSFLLVPAGVHKYSAASAVMNTAYIISRKDLSRPAVQLPGASKPTVAVRFCPILFSLRGTNSAGFFKLPYRIVFAVATLDSLYIYDTESLVPIAIFAGLHYAAITDIAWSPSAKYLALSSRDGYCTILEFENNELGVPLSLSEANKTPERNTTPINMKPEVIDGMDIDNFEASKPEAKTVAETKGEKLALSTPKSTKVEKPTLSTPKSSDAKAVSEIKEEKPALPAPKSSDASKSAKKKRITPIAIT